MERLTTALLVGGFALMAGSDTVHAKQARCFTAETGFYSCQFEGLKGDFSPGSFSFASNENGSGMMQIVEPGVGQLFFYDPVSGRSFDVGIYDRDKQDGACWVGRQAGNKFCVY